MTRIDRAADAREKLARVRAWLGESGKQGALFTSQASLSWLSGGRWYVNQATEGAVASLLVTMDAVHLLANRIESQRLLNEEINPALGAAPVVFEWFESDGAAQSLAKLLPADALLREAERPDEAAALRDPLTAADQERLRAVGRDAAEALEATCRGIARGQTEWRIAAELAKACLEREMEPIVNLAAVDGRASECRHPLPTSRVLDRYAMVVVCARRHGLIASATRLVHFGAVPGELLRRHRASAAIDAAFIASTRPGARVADIFRTARAEYAAQGFADEWRLHHQGGRTGYASRDYLARPDSREAVRSGQAYAWNPSAAGAKSEDTVLVGEAGNDIITRTGEFPELSVEWGGQTVLRPDILVRGG